MPFAERYLNALNSSNLQDDELHRQTEPLKAAALADLSGGSGSVFGSMLARAKVDVLAHKTFESGTQGLTALIRVWREEVRRRGTERKWVKIGSERDIQTAHALYMRVSEKSLAHWLDPNCKVCNGTKVVARQACKGCGGSGVAPIECTSQYERERIKDMVSDLEGIYQSHGSRAGAKMRQAA
jgi:DnaJ-class molecular chaperone